MAANRYTSCRSVIRLGISELQNVDFRKVVSGVHGTEEELAGSLEM